MNILAFVDPALGRAGIPSLSDQTLMELFATDLNSVSTFQDEDDHFHPISRWPGVGLNECGEVEHIFWPINGPRRPPNDTIFTCGGAAHMEFLPRGLLDFDIFGLKLSGTIETATLPGNLRSLLCGMNLFSGTFATAHLPDSIDKVSIEDNAFSGGLDLRTLPAGLEMLIVNANQFEGSVELNHLPAKLRVLKLDSNRFSGTIDMCNLPPNLRLLWLQNNAISQDVLRFHNTQSVQNISIDACRFDRIVDIEGRDVDADTLRRVFPSFVRRKALWAITGGTFKKKV